MTKVPDGWQLVPIEPTAEMIEAMTVRRTQVYSYRGFPVMWDHLGESPRNLYARALAVAPKVPE